MLITAVEAFGFSIPVLVFSLMLAAGAVLFFRRFPMLGSGRFGKRVNRHLDVRKAVLVLGACFVLLLAASPLFSQGAAGSIAGTVLDTTPRTSIPERIQCASRYKALRSTTAIISFSESARISASMSSLSRATKLRPSLSPLKPRP